VRACVHVYIYKYYPGIELSHAGAPACTLSALALVYVYLGNYGIAFMSGRSWAAPGRRPNLTAWRTAVHVTLTSRSVSSALQLQ